MQGAIVVDNLTIKYGKRVAVDNIKFVIQKGEVFGFLGPNGSGKTTLIKALCGLIPPASGKANILGLDIYSDRYEIRDHIGYMSQKFSLYEDLTVKENIDFYAGVYRLFGDYLTQRKQAVIELTGLEEFINARAAILSGGWKQRLALACAIIHEPEVVFLDEPTAGIDPVARREIWDLIFMLASQGITFFVTTHYMDEAERCGRVGYIYYSKLIACGTVDELKSLPEVSPKNTIRLEITCRAPSLALAFTKNLSYIQESTIFGQSIHVLMQANYSVSQLISDLSKAGFGTPLVNQIIPSLEDVFVSLTNKFIYLKSAGAKK